MNEELVKKIEGILNQYAAEELGNRVSQFSLLALKEMVINEIRNYGKDEKVKDDKAIPK